jgi:glycosyltransferase involved in cell wall biosynthesis
MKKKFFNWRAFGKNILFFLKKDSSVYLFIKRFLYYKIPVQKVFFNNFKSLVYSGKRFYYFKYLGSVIAFDSGPLNDPRGQGKIATNIFRQLDEELGKVYPCGSLEQTFDLTEGEVDLFIFPSIHWVDDKFIKKSIVFVMDVLPLSLPNVFPRSVVRQWRNKYCKSIRAAKAVVTISNWSFIEIIKNVKVSEDSVFVINPGVEQNYLAEPITKKKSLHIPRGPYFIFIGSNDYHKNLQVIIEAMMYKSLSNIKLVVVGENFSYEQKRQWLNFTNERIFFYGYLDESNLSKLLSRSKGLLLPSYNEGFGLTPFEAALHDVPSVCSNRPAMNQLLKGACFFANPFKKNEWKDSMLEILQNDEAVSVRLENAKFLASSFNWRRFFTLFMSNVSKLLLVK